jgi:hypothetical protein
MTDPASYRAGLEAAARVCAESAAATAPVLPRSVGDALRDAARRIRALPVPVPAAPEDDEARNVRMSPQAIALQECEAVCTTLRMENERLARSAIIPTGWKLVPMEPTESQWKQGVLALAKGGVKSTYRAMLAAAPTQGGGE